MTDELLIQGSEEWKLARMGSLGASSIHEALARVKSGWGASRANVAARLIVERLTGLPTDGYTNAAMAWGQEKEPEAKAAYSFFAGLEVVNVGLIRHPTIKRTHASPDGMIGNDGLLEIKCPQSATHIETLLGDPIEKKYLFQMQWQLACTGRQWCDFVSFDPRLPIDLQLKTQRIMRDDTLIASLETEVGAFLAEVDAKLDQLLALQEAA